jgi:sec-independent protein translocase protein TatB
MFDIGFSELVVIAVVALIVIGPERLPKAARTMGHLFGRLQRYVNEVKSDISREMELDELRKLQKEVQSAAQDLKSSVENAAGDVQSGIKSVEQQLQENAVETAAADPMAADTRTAPLFESLPPAGEPGGELADATPSPPSRQPSLPGFDKI